MFLKEGKMRLRFRRQGPDDIGLAARIRKRIPLLWLLQSDEGNPFRRKLRIREGTVLVLLFLAASFAVVVSAAIVLTLVDGSWDFFTNSYKGVVASEWSGVSIGKFLSGTEWIPSGREPRFGVLALVSGTTLVAGGALLIATPIGIGSAIFMSEFAGRRVRSIAKPILEILAGIPSVVYGFFALMTISPIFRDMGADYFNAISAMIVLAIMILPIIVSISDDAMRAVPNHLREASYAMGATKWETSTKIVMPAASSGIMASILLGLGRALGETMTVTLAAGQVARFHFDPFSEVQTMTAYIAQVATGDIPPGTPAVDAAFAVGLTLFVITFVVNAIAAQVVLRIKRGHAMITKPVPRYSEWLAQRWKDLKYRLRSALPARRVQKQVSLRWRYIKEKIGVASIVSCFLVAVVFLAILLYSVGAEGLQHLSWDFLTTRPSYLRPEEAGIGPVIMGSIYLMLITMVFTVPTGVGAAVYLNEFAKDTAYTRFLRRLIQNLAGVPSIVFGLLGFFLFVRAMELGTSLLAAGLTLGIMVLPIVVVATEEALKSVPFAFREAALSVGATRWQAVRHHVLPNALPGILTGSVLSLSRAIGETAPILFMAAAFTKAAPTGIMDSFMALPVTIFNWTRFPQEIFHEKAASTIIVLLIILLSMNAFAIVIRNRAEKKRDW